MRDEIIGKSHRSRMAVVYVRQSSEIQVKNNTSSQIYQREQRKYAEQYGWEPNKIQIVEDMGVSASLSGNRIGFEDILKRIDNNEIGALFYHDLSRISRNTLEFHRLFVKCKIHNVLFFEDGRLIDPKDSIDAFTAAIRADVAQLENLDRTKKMQDGITASVKSGKAVSRPPIGYVCKQKGKWIKHPDESVRSVVDQVFQCALAMPSMYAVYQHFLRKKILLPRRTSMNVFDLEIAWVEPTYSRIIGLLRNENFTPDYYYKRRVADMCCGLVKSGKNKGKGRLRKNDPENVLIFRDHHEGYISRDDYKILYEKFRNNSFKVEQPPREGKNLLQGIIYCGHCGRRMGNNYSMGKFKKRYYLTAFSLPDCPVGLRFIDAERVDEAVIKNLLNMIERPQVEKALQMYKQSLKMLGNGIQDHMLKLNQLEANAIKTEKAYMSADKNNDLVRKILEKNWQNSLLELEECKNEKSKPVEIPPPVTEKEKHLLEYLCNNFESAFSHESVDIATKKRLIKCFLKKVVLFLKEDLIVLELSWKDHNKSKTTLVIQTKRSVYRYILAQYEKGLDEQGILDEMKRNNIGIPNQIFTRRSISRYISRRGLVSCSTRRRTIINEHIWKYHLKGLNAARIASRLNYEGIRSIRGKKFKEANLTEILGNLLHKKGKSCTQIAHHHWDIIKKLIDDGKDVHDIVSQLNSQGLKTAKGRQYSYWNLRRIIYRHGINPPKKEKGLSMNIQDKLREFNKSGLLCRQAYDNLMKAGLISPNDSFAHQKVSSYYKSLSFSKNSLAKMIPSDFAREIYMLIDKGLNLSKIVEELNKRGMKTIKGKAYRKNTVRTYCRQIGIQLNRRNYLDESKLMEQIDIAVSSGKSCKLIAEKINEMGFTTYIGREFKPGDIRDILARQGRKATNPCRSEYIIVEIRPLAEAGYHPRTIARKLNAKGVKTVNGNRIKIHSVDYYLRKIKAIDAK